MRRISLALTHLLCRLPPVSRQTLEAALYLADLEIFHRTGETMTGASWQRRGVWPAQAGFGAALEELEQLGLIRSFDQRLLWQGRACPPTSSEWNAGLALIADLVARTTQKALRAIVGGTSPFADVDQDAGVELLFRHSPTPPNRHPRAAARIRAAFKLAELGRIADLQEQALATTRR